MCAWFANLGWILSYRGFFQQNLSLLSYPIIWIDYSGHSIGYGVTQRMEVFWCETMQNLQCRLPHTWRLLGFFFPRHTFFHRKSECFINYCKFPFNVCNPDPSILIRLDMRANKRQEVKSERAKNNFYFSLFCTVEFDTPSLKHAHQPNGLS